MNTVYFIGGPTRAGKSTLAHQLISSKPIHLVSSDFALEGSRSFFVDDPFQILKSVSYSGTTTYKHRDSGELTTEDFEYKSDNELELARKFLNGGFDYFQRNNLDFAVEGHAVTPEWVDEVELKDFNKRAVFVGWLSDNHAENVLAHALDNQHDWMNEWLARFDEGERKAKVEKFVVNQIEANRTMQQKAQSLGFDFVDVSKGDFTSQIEQAAKLLTSK